MPRTVGVLFGLSILFTIITTNTAVNQTLQCNHHLKPAE